MSTVNGSFITSQLPQASNVASSDRILIIFNAAANASVSNGSPSTRTISVSNFVNSVSNKVSLMSWANNITFDSNNISYSISLNDCYVFIDTNDQGNCSVILPSATANGKGYVIKKTSANNSDTIALSTDNANSCMIEGANSFTMNSSVEFVKGLDGNFWIISQY